VEHAALEAELSRIPGVTAARVVLDDAGAPSEIHVLATPDKPAKQVVRDIQSVALARFDVEVDRRIVSVVQLESPPAMPTGVGARGDDDQDDEGAGSRQGAGPGRAGLPGRAERSAGAGDERDAGRLPRADEDAARPRRRAEDASAPAPGPGLDRSRVTLMGVSVSRDGFRQTVEVTLSWRGTKAVGWESGAATASGTHRQVALATLAALHQIEPATEATDIEVATVARSGERDIASVTVLVLDPPHEQLLSGTAVVRGTGGPDAVARAVLDALNRRLGGASFSRG
jgi:hypothetical protein